MLLRDAPTAPVPWASIPERARREALQLLAQILAQHARDETLAREDRDE
jgi:hypothetical protein